MRLNLLMATLVAVALHARCTSAFSIPFFQKQTEEEEGLDVDHPPHESQLLKKCDPCPATVLCVPQIQCPAHVRMKDHEKPQVCDLPGGKFGFCCVTGQNHTAFRELMARTVDAPMLSMELVEEARLKFEQLMHQVKSLPVKRGQPDFLHGIAFHSSSVEDLKNFQLSNSAMEQIITGQLYSQKEQIPLDDLITNNINVDFTQTPLAQHCTEHHRCRNPLSPYRSYDGSCNNPIPQRSHWGAAGQPMERLLPPAYEDGLWEPRMHSVVDGSPLRGAREVSRTLIQDIDRPHPRHNVMMMQFGQFIAHDVTQSASVRLESGELVQCCTQNGEEPLPAEQRHFACLPINIEDGDEFYKDYKVRCMNFVRLSLAPHTDCRIGYGKQRSKVTHFLDASPVYGSSKDTVRSLRSFNKGKLRMMNDFGRELLPLTDDKKACESEEQERTCFKSGDGRTNQIISLIVLHLIFAREHNRIAEILSQLNPHHSDERLFQEARRIVIAEYQHIVYNEYLPLVVGSLQMKRFRLVPQHHGYSNAYSNEINPAITNEFSGAAFRMGHSTVDGRLYLYKNANNTLHEMIDIPDVMFNPSRMRKRTFLDDMLRSMAMQPMQKVDSSITYGLSRYLFRGHHPFGLDLAAFNIQRGRDQGLRSYNDYLEVMGHRRIHSFNQLPKELGQKLSRVYTHPDDIDLWVGGLQEKPVEDGIVGITFAEIIADQFSRFKRGDRYFYEYSAEVNPGAFTLNQLHEIRKVTLARILCDNADHLSMHGVPLAAFVRTDFPGNTYGHCEGTQIPSVDLGAWRE